MMATVLRARKTRKVRSAARLPRSIPIVMYLKKSNTTIEYKCAKMALECQIVVQILLSFDAHGQELAYLFPGLFLSPIILESLKSTHAKVITMKSNQFQASRR